MIKTHDASSVTKMYDAGRIAALTLDKVEEYLKLDPYRKTIDIEKLCEDSIRSHGGIPECIGYRGRHATPYPYASCISVNDVACHGFPSDYVLQDGDILNVDIVVRYNGWLADTSRSFGVGNITKADAELLRIAKQSMYEGMKAVKIWRQFNVIGAAIEAYCEKQTADGEPVCILRDYLGHGISKRMHEQPLVEHVRNRCPELLRPYLYFTIEPIIALGTNIRTYMDDNQWAVKMVSGKRAAQFEHTMGLNDKGELMVFTTRDKEHEHQVLAELNL